MEIVIKIILIISTITLIIGVILAIGLIAFILKYGGVDEPYNPDEAPPQKNSVF